MPPGATDAGGLLTLACIALMLVVGRRLIPWILHYIAHTGSRELFRLAVLAIALGVAFGSTKLFDVSLALGAFFAGMMLRESPRKERLEQAFALHQQLRAQAQAELETPRHRRWN